MQSRIACCCDGPLGAVSELERPSWFTTVLCKIISGSLVESSSWTRICITPADSARA